MKLPFGGTGSSVQLVY